MANTYVKTTEASDVLMPVINYLLSLDLQGQEVVRPAAHQVRIPGHRNTKSLARAAPGQKTKG